MVHSSSLTTTTTSSSSSSVAYAVHLSSSPVTTHGVVMVHSSNLTTRSSGNNAYAVYLLSSRVTNHSVVMVHSSSLTTTTTSGSNAIAVYLTSSTTVTHSTVAVHSCVVNALSEVFGFFASSGLRDTGAMYLFDSSVPEARMGLPAVTGSNELVMARCNRDVATVALITTKHHRGGRL
jgi:hypothetical protein